MRNLRSTAPLDESGCARLHLSGQALLRTADSSSIRFIAPFSQACSQRIALRATAPTAMPVRRPGLSGEPNADHGGTPISAPSDAPDRAFVAPLVRAGRHIRAYLHGRNAGDGRFRFRRPHGRRSPSKRTPSPKPATHGVGDDRFASGTLFACDSGMPANRTQTVIEFFGGPCDGRLEALEHPLDDLSLIVAVPVPVVEETYPSDRLSRRAPTRRATYELRCRHGRWCYQYSGPARCPRPNAGGWLASIAGWLRRLRASHGRSAIGGGPSF